MKTTLSDVTEFIIDTKHNTPEYAEAGYPCIRTPNIGRGYLIFENIKYVNGKFYKRWTERAVPRTGDLILAREAPVGNVAWIPSNLKPCIGQRTVLIRPKVNSIVSRYLMYLLLGDECQNLMLSMSSGATVAHLNMGDIRKLELPKTPPLTTQLKISSILSAYDDLIENNLRRIKILEEMAQNLYREWFVKFRFPGHENTHFVDSPMGRIPEGWKISKLGDISSVTPGYAFKSKDWSKKGIAVIKIKNIKPGNLVDVEQIDHIPKNILSSRLQKYWLKNGDIIIAMTGATAGKVGKIRTKKPLLLNQRVAKIEPKSSYVQFVWCTISTHEAEKKFYALADGAAQPNMSATQIENPEVIIPLTDLLKQFEEIVSPLIESVDNMIMKNHILRQTRDLLLPKIISGEVDVTDLNIDMPKEVEV